MLLPACADPSTGRALFEQRCISCHRSGASALHTPAADLRAVLRSGDIRSHRFQLSDSELNDLEAYLAKVQTH